MNRKDKDNLINFFELETVKPYLNKRKDTQKEFTGMPICQHILVTGSTGAGKTSSFLLNYIERTSRGKGTFDKIYMCVKKMEEFNYFLKDRLKGFIEFYHSVEEMPNANEFKDLGKSNDSHNLIIFDDCINDTSKQQTKKINEYFTYGRSKGCTVIFLTQSYYQTEIFVRKQVSFVIMCGSKGQDRKRILADFPSDAITGEVLERMYKYCKSPDPGLVRDNPFMKICTYECPIDKKVSKNFLEYLDPNDFN